MEPKNKKSTPKEEEEGPVDIFVHGLHPFTLIEDIIETFKPFTIIKNIEFKRNPITGKHRGFAFFQVDNHEIAEKIIAVSHVLGGRKIYCDYKNSDKASQRKNEKKRIFVGGIAQNTTDKDLEEAFREFGEIRAAYTIKSLNGDCKGFGYVDFSTNESAEQAVKRNKVFVKGKLADVRIFEKDDKKKAKKDVKTNENGYLAPGNGYNELGQNLTFGVDGSIESQFLGQMMLFMQTSQLDMGSFGQGNLILGENMPFGQGNLILGENMPFGNENQLPIYNKTQFPEKNLLLQGNIYKSKNPLINDLQMSNFSKSPSQNSGNEPIFGPPPILEERKEILEQEMRRRAFLVDLDFDYQRNERNTVKEIILVSNRMQQFEKVRDCYVQRKGTKTVEERKKLKKENKRKKKIVKRR